MVHRAWSLTRWHTYRTEQRNWSRSKLTKEIFATVTETKDKLDKVLERNSFWIIVRATTWVRKFLNNCKQKKSAERKRKQSKKTSWPSTCKRTASSCTSAAAEYMETTKSIYHWVLLEKLVQDVRHADITWRSWFHNGVDQTWLLDTPTKAVDQEGHQWLHRMQEVPSKGL